MVEGVIFALLIISGLAMVISGGFFLFEVFVLVKLHLNNSLNSDLDVVKIVKKKKPEVSQDKEKNIQLEKEEVSVMEHLLATLSNIHTKKNFMHRIFYGEPQIVFEIAVPSNSEQISFFVAMPSKLRELVEKQIHSFYPSAHIEKVEDYTIFYPNSSTVGSTLKFKKDSAYPIKTYQQLEADPLNNITNALSKLIFLVAL